MSAPFRRVAAARGEPARPRGGVRVACQVSRAMVSSTVPKRNMRQIKFEDMAGNPLALPRLPIPTLKDTVSRYLEVGYLLFVVVSSALWVPFRFHTQQVLVSFDTDL